MITKVVVPLDGSALAERALGPGRALAEKAATPLVLLTSRWDRDVDTPRQYLKQTAADLGCDRAETRLVYDRLAASAILTEIDDPGAVICISTHGRGGMSEYVLGSVAQEVLRHCANPVVLVGPRLSLGAWESEQAFDEGKLLVTVDGSDSSQAIVPVAAQWAETLELAPCVVQVLQDGEPLVAQRAAEDSALRHAVASLANGAASAQWEVLHDGDPAAAILDHARRLPATLVAMATRCRTGLVRVTLGSVATQVVRRSQCPVLVARAGNVN
jgi:nucleotide-binding universal stress UspA family protein